MRRKTVHILRNMRLLFIVVVLALLVSACSTVGVGAKIPPPTLEYGWSVEMEMEINRENKRVKCMALDDIRKVDIYMELLKANEEVGR